MYVSITRANNNSCTRLLLVWRYGDGGGTLVYMMPLRKAHPPPPMMAKSKYDNCCKVEEGAKIEYY
jgi:hypothetical protein